MSGVSFDPASSSDAVMRRPQKYKSYWYMGCYLERAAPTCQFRWYSWCDGSKYADTLAELKQLIKHTLKK